MGERMGFDIALAWREPTDDPVGRNRLFTESLLARVPGLAGFPLDHDHVADTLGVPRSAVLDHWPQIELNADNRLIGASITLWLDRAYVELPSVPPGSCAEALEAAASLLAVLEAGGLSVVDPEQLLAEYEAQRARVIRVTEVTGGLAGPPAAHDRAGTD
jgi:hypothetical protein